MGKCDKCGNDYDKSFQVIINNQTFTFDCFECAISIAAPKCMHCNCAIIGHGVENKGIMFCCAHCGNQHAGEGKLIDRIT